MRSNIIVVLILGPIAGRWSCVFTAESFFNISLYLHLGEPGFSSPWDRSTLHMNAQRLVEQSGVIIGLVSNAALWQLRAVNIW